MESGIYKLTFSSGRYYIGKSIDIPTRWKQHEDKFRRGKAAQRMQTEFDHFGIPKGEVIYRCHKDHIDILEEIFIDIWKGPDMLNGTFPDCENTEQIRSLIDRNHELLELSTLDHLSIMETKSNELAMLLEELKKSNYKVEEYKQNGYIIDDDYSTMVDIATHYKELSESEHEELETLQQELLRLKQLTWWQRLWSYRVYV